MRIKHFLIALLIPLFIGGFVFAQSFIYPEDGGTGITTIPKAGQLLIGVTDGVYNPAWLTAGSNITIATSSGAITINSTDGGLATSSPFTVGYIPYATSSSAVTDSVIFQLGNNVGIGTTTPAYTLDVYGDARANYFTTNSLVDGYYIGPYDNYMASMYYQDNIFKFYSDSKQYAFWGLTNGFLKVDANGLMSTSTIDISDNTNLAAGRSLTMSGDSVEADAELYTRSFTFAIKNATTTSNPAAQHSLPTAITITKVKCSNSLATVTFQLDERAEATPFTAGTDIMSSALGCGTGLASTTAFANAGIAADNWISLDIDATNNAATSTNITVYYTLDD